VNLSVCIATYRREERLAALLEDLMRQQLKPDEVVVVDNDVTQSARGVVEERARGCPYPIIYDVQPERSIALTRNRTVHLARGQWLAFIDDDERAPPQWLKLLRAAADTYGADGVLAPVEPQVPASAPAWLRRGKFYDWPHLPSGARVPPALLRFGNVLLRSTVLQAEPGPFDPSYRLSTGEDDDLLRRLLAKGARIIWCDEALVWEPVERQRQSLRWLMKRALGGGQHFAQLRITGRLGPVGPASRAFMCARWALQLLIALALAALLWPAGKHRAAVWLIKASANLGKLTALWGWRYSQYA